VQLIETVIGLNSTPRTVKEMSLIGCRRGYIERQGGAEYGY